MNEIAFAMSFHIYWKALFAVCHPALALIFIYLTYSHTTEELLPYFKDWKLIFPSLFESEIRSFMAAVGTVLPARSNITTFLFRRHLQESRPIEHSLRYWTYFDTRQQPYANIVLMRNWSTYWVQTFRVYAECLYSRGDKYELYTSSWYSSISKRLNARTSVRTLGRYGNSLTDTKWWVISRELRAQLTEHAQYLLPSLRIGRWYTNGSCK
jgi:hypothetical protein